jgi:hypothetical protein
MNKKEYITAIIIKTDKAITSSEEINKRLGLEEILFQEKPWAKDRRPRDFNYWIFESPIEDQEPLIDHLTSLASSFPDNFEMKTDKHIREVFLDIGFLYNSEETPFGSFNLDIKLLKVLESFFPGLSLEVTVYP